MLERITAEARSGDYCKISFLYVCMANTIYLFSFVETQSNNKFTCFHKAKQVYYRIVVDETADITRTEQNLFSLDMFSTAKPKTHSLVSIQPNPRKAK